MIQELIQGASEQGFPANGHPGSDIDAGDARIWAARITERWRASVQAIIDVGRILLEAKARMPHGAFGDMCETQLPFSARTAQRLMAIASDNRLTNPTHVSLLPASWGTLAELSQLSDDEFSSGLAQKIIRPDMIRADVEHIRALVRPIESQAKATEGKAGMAGGVEAPVRGSTAGTGLRVGEASADLPATSEFMDVTAGETAPNSPAMPSGGLAIAHRCAPDGDPREFFPTPPWATRALFEHVLVHLERRGHCKFQKAWEPASGDGHMAEPMREYFKAVITSDKYGYSYGGEHPIDFLDEGLACPTVDWIITNPPFKQSTDFVLKALARAGTGVAMFVRTAWLEGIDRYERIFLDHPPTLISFFTERVPLHKGRWEPDGSTMTAYIWLVWIKGAAPQAPFWIPPGCREALSKPEDVKRFGKDEAA